MPNNNLNSEIMKIYLVKKVVKFKDFKDNKKQITLESTLWADRSLEDAKKDIEILTENSKDYKDGYERQYNIQEIELYR